MMMRGICHRERVLPSERSVASQIFSIIPSEITNYGNADRFYNIPQQLLWNAVVLVDPD